MRCARCDSEVNIIDLGDETNLYIKGVKARYMCFDCSERTSEKLKKFLVSAPVKLTAKEQELEDYFKE
jgi:DNA-directed RNA polymerase subunit RPC12/RpoP